MAAVQSDPTHGDRQQTGAVPGTGVCGLCVTQAPTVDPGYVQRLEFSSSRGLHGFPSPPSQTCSRVIISEVLSVKVAARHRLHTRMRKISERLNKRPGRECRRQEARVRARPGEAGLGRALGGQGVEAAVAEIQRRGRTWAPEGSGHLSHSPLGSPPLGPDLKPEGRGGH